MKNRTKLSPNKIQPPIPLLKKITTNTVEEHFFQPPVDANIKSVMDNGYNWYDPGISVPEPDPENEEDVIRVNVPLMIRLLEYAREHASDDVVLHVIVERMTELCEDGDVLEMEDYTGIVPAAENGTE